MPAQDAYTMALRKLLDMIGESPGPGILQSSTANTEIDSKTWLQQEMTRWRGAKSEHGRSIAGVIVEAYQAQTLVCVAEQYLGGKRGARDDLIAALDRARVLEQNDFAVGTLQIGIDAYSETISVIEKHVSTISSWSDYINDALIAMGAYM